MKKIIYASLLLNPLLFGAGYQIPNNTVNSNALATAYIANANGADSAYFNPANMIYNEDKNELEITLSYINLPSMKYTPKSSGNSIKTKQYDTVIPSLHYVSSKLLDTNIRFGFSLTVPYGLTREWNDQPAISTANKFALKTIEFNPTIAIPITNKLSVALGIRYMRGEGEVKLDGSPIYSVDMDGDDDDWAYNIALSYRVTEKLKFALTYRSALSLNLAGSADVVSPWLTGSTAASLPIEIPDNLIFAGTYLLNDSTSIEITYDQTFWSNVSDIDFYYANSTLESSLLGASNPRLWDDTVAYRLGITHALENEFIFMCGIAYSDNAADEKYVSYSSPEANSITYAFGGRYTFDDAIDIGLAFIYADYEDRTSLQGTPTGVNGTFSEKYAYSVTTGVSYKF